MDRFKRFQIAAGAYLVYGLLYLAGAIHLISQGIGVRGGTATGAHVLWFVLGFVFVVLFPWLIWKAPHNRGCLWFARILAVLVFYRAFEVARIAVAPGLGAIPLMGGLEISMAVGAWLFFLITLAAGSVLAWASWRRF